jgi:mutator protein MutT
VKSLRVCAAYIELDGLCLLCDRPGGSFMEGKWEFPGGKIAPGETQRDCLVREIREELGITVTVFDMMFFTEHCYPEKTVSLFFHRCAPAPLSAEPRPLEGQNILWVPRGEIVKCDLLPADRPFARFLSGCAE